MEDEKRDKRKDHKKPREPEETKIKQGEALIDNTLSQAPPLQKPGAEIWKLFGNSNSWMALFTGILTVVAYLQLQVSCDATQVAKSSKEVADKAFTVSEHALKQSEQSMKIAARAWIVPDTASVNGPIELNKLHAARITFKNTGQSPARKMMLRHQTSIWKVASLPSIPMPEIKIKGLESQTVLGPNVSSHSDAVLDAPLTKEQVSRLKNKEWILVTFGEVKYWDVFDEEHKTHFCLMWVNLSGNAMSPCNTWNDAN